MVKQVEFRQRVSIVSNHPDYTCGLGSCRPRWLQYFAKPQFFFINFVILSVLQGAFRTYMVGTMTTVEKRFGFESKITGIIMIADNISQIIIGPFMGYLGTRFNRPRLLAIGILFVAVGVFSTGLPYFIYGPAIHLLMDENLIMKNQTKIEFCEINNEEICTGAKTTVMGAVVIFWIANFFNGIGSTAFYVLGFPHLDDSFQKKNSPIYLSISSTLRLSGPALGYLLSSTCLSLYEDPSIKPKIALNDPRWVGAWWLGYIILSVCLILVSFPMLLFPKQFKSVARRQEKTIEKKLGVIESLKLLVKNPILMFNTIGSSFRYLGLAGYFVFKPKYLESQFGTSAAGANFLTGSTSIIAQALGILGGGFAIAKFRPSPKALLTYMFCLGMFFNATIFSSMFLGCPPPPMAGVDNNGMLDFTNNCNKNCGCTTKAFRPACDLDQNITYFSPCFAGCKTQLREGKKLSFKDCNCIDEMDSSNFGSIDGETDSTNRIIDGYCPRNCGNLYIYLALLSITGLVTSTGSVGNILIALRSVDQKLKSFAMGMMSTVMALLAWIPYPLIFGAIVDSTCIVWQEVCGSRGNCWIYDSEKMRTYLHGGAVFFMVIGSMFDLLMIFKANHLKNIYDDEIIEEVEEDKEAVRLKEFVQH